MILYLIKHLFRPTTEDPAAAYSLTKEFMAFAITNKQTSVYIGRNGLLHMSSEAEVQTASD